jgi:hypothetical protein
LTFDVDASVAEYIQRVALMVDELEKIPGVTVQSSVTVNGITVSLPRS